MKRTSWVALVALTGIAGFVVYSSLEVGSTRCEVCLEFRGRRACRAVDGATEEEAYRAALTNVCAQLASGVTDSLACERTDPLSRDCRPR
jgi:hypothetical protein